MINKYLPVGICMNYNVLYNHANIYLGRGNTLLDKIYINITFSFKSRAEMGDFLKWWRDDINHGSSPFYAELSLFDDMGTPKQNYLIAQEGSLRETFSPSPKITGKFLYLNKTHRANMIPVVIDIAKGYKEGSTNNFIVLKGTDADNDILSYVIVDAPQHGTVVLNKEGTVYYSPTKHYVGTDTFTYKAFDGLRDSNIAKVTINLTVRDTDSFLVLDTAGTAHEKFTDKDNKYLLTKEII